MRVGIDCRLAGTAHAGIGRYVQHLVRELLKIEPNSNNWVLFFYSQQQAQEVLGNLYEKAEVVIVSIKHYSLKEQLLLPFKFYSANLDILHVPHFNVPILYWKKTVITIHDLLWHIQRGTTVTTLSPLVYWLKYLFYHLVTWAAIKKAETIFVPAQTIKKTVSSFYPHSEKKIVVTKEGIGEGVIEFKNQKIKRKKHQLLYVGSLYPHKNIDIVLKALQQLPQYQLIIVSSRDVFHAKTQKRTKELAVSSQVHFAGRVSDKQLAHFYQESQALIQPSLSEGFGLTGIEALSVSTPVIASDIEIFHEIYQDCALYFNPQDENSFVSTVKKLHTINQNSLKQKVKKLLKQYSWQEMAQITYQQYT